MSYLPQDYATVLELWDADDYEQFRQNMAAMPAALFTQKGQIAVGTGNQALAVITAGNDGCAIVVDTAETTGMRFEGGCVPLGSIIVWSGSQASIPTGWQLCNGTNGTPDLRDKFVIGAGGDYAVGSSGSGYSLVHTHTLPGITLNSASDAHTHTQGNVSSESSHAHALASYSFSESGQYIQYASASQVYGATRAHTHTMSVGTTSAGSAHNHTNPSSASSGGAHTHTVASQPTSFDLGNYLPPYYALCYIQRVL